MGLGRTIAEIVPLALTVAFTMLPIIATLAVLVSSERATRGFLLSGGYAIGLLLVLGLATLGLRKVGLPSIDVSPIVFIVVGLALMALAAWRLARRTRASTNPKRSPALLAHLESLSRPGALAIGFQFAFHPENLLLIGAASTKVAAAHLHAAEDVIVVVIFCLIGVSTVALPSTVYALAGPRMKLELATLRDWLVAHATTITCVLLGAVGVFLVVYGAWKLLG